MIAAAERSVIITLKLAADEQNKATAGLVASQAESVALAGNEGYDKLLKIAAETDNRINQVHAAQGKLRVDLDRQEVGERLRIVEDAVVVFAESEKKKTEVAENEDENREKKRLADQKKQEKEDKKKLKKAKEFAQKLQKAEETRVASNQKANESAVIAVQGMADMVEGAAKLGMISEENFEKFAQNFHMIQDGIRVFKGFTDVIWKTREGLVALSAASKAQAVANEMISASNLKATASTTVTGGTQVVGRTAAGVGSKVAGGAAMGVGGTTVAAGGSVVGGALIFAKIAAVMAGLAAAGLAVHDLFKGFLSLFIDFGEDAGTASLAVKGLCEAQEQEAKSTEKLTKAEEARQRILDARARFEDQEAKKADLERDLRGAQYDVRESRSIAGGETVSETDRARLTALEDVRAAENAILDDRKKQEDRIAYGHWESLNNRERVMKDLEAAQGRLLEAEKNRLKVIVDQKKQIGEQLKAEKEKLKVAEDATKSEKQRLLERYGRLNKLEKSRVDAIGLKQAQGG